MAGRTVGIISAVDVDRPPVAPAFGVAEAFDYDTIPAGYYDAAFRRGRGVQSKWHHLKFARVTRELRGARRVLDVGCGPGTMLGHLGPEHDGVGVDLARAQIAFARRAYGSATRRFYAAGPQELPADEGPFDAVTLVELIEHLSPDDVDAMLGAALARLRPGGRLVVTTPNFRSPWPLVEAAVDRLGPVHYEFQHINRFDRGRLLELLRAHDLLACRVDRYLVVSPFAAVAGWRLADRVARLERPLERRLGMLLLGTGVKPGPR